MKVPLVLVLFALLSFGAGQAQAQRVKDTLRYSDDLYWTLPTTECDGDNFCEVRISPQGTIYGWDFAPLSSLHQSAKCA